MLWLELGAFGWGTLRLERWLNSLLVLTLVREHSRNYALRDLYILITKELLFFLFA